MSERFDIAKDKFGNAIYADTRTTEIFLELSTGKRRSIAKYRKHEKILTTKRKISKHQRLRKGGPQGSYGFCDEMLYYFMTEGYTHIKLTDEEFTWKIPIAVIRDWKNYLHFKKQGFERQLFAPVHMLKEFIWAYHTKEVYSKYLKDLNNSKKPVNDDQMELF